MLNQRALALLVLTAVLGCSSSSSTGAGYTPTTDTSDLCTTPLAPNEPLCSTAFGDTVWSASHRASYAQGSSPFAGPTDSATSTSEHLTLEGAGVPVVMSFSAPYEDGGRAVWSVVTGAQAAIVKVDHETFEIIDTYVPTEREDSPPTFTLGLSGAYTAIDSKNRFIAGRTRFVGFYGDSVDGDRSSPIELKKRIFMPDGSTSTRISNSAGSEGSSPSSGCFHTGTMALLLTSSPSGPAILASGSSAGAVVRVAR